ncbi:glycosyltransferase [Actinoplanes awajinensis]|uniref:4,4'-diaponeurosporenoate glycosyltransferase n=1 Tax=Actinoplanes awajinensis subsp. mycoplanecinus TaxID=135947 RepID=A0A0X3V5D0_9ACTN|nr:glycosyltransferase [Actinoplanes awajinensis]KUL40011.1 glycosyltransferase [Actinoplanes awajinensis subsp. mycoplanecinus]
MTSIVIAAHNEAAVIGRCLDALLAGAAPGEFDVTVVANGCTDDTVAAATRPGVRVLDLATPGKAHALNAGDEVAVGFPRIYLDADIVLSTAAVRALGEALDRGALAATVGRQLVLDGRPVAVRAYFAVHGRLPVFRDGLFGRGVLAVSAAGRARFGTFPELVADDLFLDSQFSQAEKAHVTAYTAKVETPRRTDDLVKRLVRVRGGNAAMRAAAERGEITVPVRPAARLSWLRDVVLPKPWLAPAAVVYVAITMKAARAAQQAGDGGAAWGRDESSRQDSAADPAPRR